MSFEFNGFELHTNFIDEQSVQDIINDIEALDSVFPKHGIRNAEKKIPSINQLVTSPLLIEKAKNYLSGSPKLVRVIIFDKTPNKNWLVTWHQDKTISVNEQQAIDGWGPWTLKDGIHHVQPDKTVLENMVTLRIHLDNANESNGCLKVIPQTHKLGILKQAEINQIVESSEGYYCKAGYGDLLSMRPLLLHSSSKCVVPTHRRVVHIEYSSYELPEGLEWA